MLAGNLENNVEIGGEPASAMAEEEAAGGIAEIRVDRFGIEVVGQIERTDGQAD